MLTTTYEMNMNWELVYKHLQSYKDACSSQKDLPGLQRHAVEMYKFCEYTALSNTIDRRTRVPIHILKEIKTDLYDVKTHINKYWVNIKDLLKKEKLAFEIDKQKKYLVSMSYVVPFRHAQRPLELNFELAISFFQYEVTDLLDECYKYVDNRIIASVKVLQTLPPILKLASELAHDLHNITLKNEFFDRGKKAKHLYDEGFDLRDDIRLLNNTISLDYTLINLDKWFDFLLLSDPSLLLRKVRGDEASDQLGFVFHRLRSLKTESTVKTLQVVANDLMEAAVLETNSNTTEAVHKKYTVSSVALEKERQEAYDEKANGDQYYKVDIGGKQLVFLVKNTAFGRETERRRVTNCQILDGKFLFSENTGLRSGKLEPKWQFLSIFLLHSIKKNKSDLIYKEEILKHAEIFKKSRTDHAMDSLNTWFQSNLGISINEYIYSDNTGEWTRNFPNAKRCQEPL